MSHIEIIFPVFLAATAILGMLAHKKPFSMPPPAGPEALGPMRQITYRQPITPVPNTTPVSLYADRSALRIVAVGTNKIQAIKTIREVRSGIGLAVAKGLLENLPQPLFRDLPAAATECVQSYPALGGVYVVVEPGDKSTSSAELESQASNLACQNHSRQSDVLPESDLGPRKSGIRGKGESLS